MDTLITLMKKLGLPLVIQKGTNANKGFFITNVRYNQYNYNALCDYVNDKYPNLVVSHKDATYKDSITLVDNIPTIEKVIDQSEVIFVSPSSNNKLTDYDSVDLT